MFIIFSRTPVLTISIDVVFILSSIHVQWYNIFNSVCFVSLYVIFLTNLCIYTYFRRAFIVGGIMIRFTYFGLKYAAMTVLISRYIMYKTFIYIYIYRYDLIYALRYTLHVVKRHYGDDFCDIFNSSRKKVCLCYEYCHFIFPIVTYHESPSIHNWTTYSCYLGEIWNNHKTHCQYTDNVKNAKMIWIFDLVTHGK